MQCGNQPQSEPGIDHSVSLRLRSRAGQIAKLRDGSHVDEDRFRTSGPPGIPRLATQEAHTQLRNAKALA
eukprot:8502180-Pyramimonas_sp.AAC.1